MPKVDYMDPDVAYLLGAIVARGEMSSEQGKHTIIIRYPKGSFIAQGEKNDFNTEKEIKLGISNIRERFLELLDSDIKTVDSAESTDLVIVSTRNTMALRNIRLILGENAAFPYFSVPDIFLDQETPSSFKREFVRGFADVAGNIRRANRDQAGRHRVRLDVLNYPSNWHVPVQLCSILQCHLGVPVGLIAWGHPNLGRKWREHQLDIYAEDFCKVGFFFDFKQQALEELAKLNIAKFHTSSKICPGVKKLQPKKPKSKLEKSEKLDLSLQGKHFNSYWQICKALGCTMKASPKEQLELTVE